jgi:hypothetical protein
MRSFACPSLLVVAVILAGPAAALDHVDPYICPSAVQGSGMECFLEAVPQTYTMCRQIKSIEIIEFGLKGAQEGVHGAKTEYCIDKHRLSIARPYQAALREAARVKEAVQSLRQLYDVWLDSLAKLIPAPDETDEGYKQRVLRPYADFSERIHALHALFEAPGKSVASAPSKATPSKSTPSKPKKTGQ